jgi:hypothetical protein
MGRKLIPNLIILYAVTCPAMASREEGDSSSKSQSTHSDISHSTSNDGKAHWREFTVDIVPPVAGAHPSLGAVLAHRDFIQVTQINRYPIIDIGGAVESSMAATLDRKLTLLASQYPQCDGDI